VWKAWREDAVEVDGTSFLVAVHQNHGYGYHPQGKQGTNEDALELRSRDLAGQGTQLKAILDSTPWLTHYGRIRRTPFRRTLSELLLMKVRQKFLEKTFAARNLLGLRSKSLDRVLDFMD
jgi:hypothetical protein